MSKRYPGGVVSATAPVVVGPVDGEGGTAPGIWTLDQAEDYLAQGLWPKPLIAGAFWSWGYNAGGTLGQNNIIALSSPVQVGALTTWSKISCGTGAQTVIAIKTDGTLWSWGDNAGGQLGLGNKVNRSSPVQVGALTTWSKIANGSAHTIAIKANGTLWTWGSNGQGQLGQNIDYLTDISSPVQVGALTTWSKIAAGYLMSVAIKTDGSLWTWGQNNAGNLGLNDIIYRSSPVQVGALTTWSSIAAGYYHVVATKTDGTLWAFGTNVVGQLGQNNIIYRSSPVQVGALTTWSKINCGIYSTVSIKTDGTLWTWGNNSQGCLGLGDLVNRSSPTQVGAFSTWLNVTAGSYFTAATKTDGTLWIWGQNSSGQLGLGDKILRSSPVQVGALTTWLKIAGGDSSLIALKS